MPELSLLMAVAPASKSRGMSRRVCSDCSCAVSAGKRAATAHARGDKLERAAALYAAWVRRPIRDKQILYSCGMHLLGERDIELGPGEHKSDDLGWMDLLALYLLAEKPGRGLSDGEGFRQRPNGERRTLRLAACDRYQPDDFAYNPFGYWQLER